MNLVTIDESGLVLIPQQVREQLGINPPAQLFLEIQAGRIILEPIPKEPEIERASGVSDVLTEPRENLDTIVNDLREERINELTSW